MSEYKIHNFVTGQDEELPKLDPNTPTDAWIAGWIACMEDGYNSNPYHPTSQEHHDYEEGYEDAERD